MKVRDPKPDIQRLEALASDIRTGDIRLPKFQRPFVWSRADMLELLDSIYKGYPIGSILLWHSSERLRSERNIVGFDLSRPDVDLYPTNYLLDGQQRLTTLCGALYWEGDDQKSRWRIYFDLEAEEFKHVREPVQPHYFPLNRLMRTSDFIKQCMTFESAPDPKRLYDTAEKLLRSIKDYKVAVVKIGDVPLDEVAPIFERINSTGRKLTMVDLMRAATWKEGFDLTEVIENIASAVDAAGFGELGDAQILRSISAAANLGINKQDIDNLRKCSSLELQRASAETMHALISALAFLKTRAGLDDLTFLPYGLQLAYATEFFRLQKNPTAAQLDRLSQWFWCTSVFRYFARASTTGQTSKDLEAMRAFARGEIDHPHLPDETDATQFMFDSFNLRTASSTAFALFLKHRMSDVRVTIHGRQFDESHVKQMERHVFEDLIPKAWAGNNRNLGQVLNPFRNTPPYHDMQDVPPEGLAANLMDTKCVELYRAQDFRGFLARRAQLVATSLVELTGSVTLFEMLFGEPEDS